MRRVNYHPQLMATVAVAAAFALPPEAPWAQSAPASSPSLPTNGKVVAGSATIRQTGPGTLTVTQSGTRSVINWQTFSVGAGEAVVFQAPSSTAATLNLVSGNAPSTIAGSVQGNDTVYLVNPNGIAITRSGTVNLAGGLVASTLPMGVDDFMHGKDTFASSTVPSGVSNAGSITVGTGGFVALIGGNVSNSGSITVPAGHVALASGQQVTIDPGGDGFLQVTLPKGATAVGQPLIDVSGKIQADGGTVTVTAGTIAQAFHNAVNISGDIQTHTISGHAGLIIIDGGAGGAVDVSGTLDASGGRQTGGTVVVTGEAVALDATARIDASGGNGGTVLVGGDARGGSDAVQDLVDFAVRDAAVTDIASGARIDIDGSHGHGGSAVIWSNTRTDFAGRIDGVGNDGNGGNVEVSSHGAFRYAGTVDLLAQGGRTGNLLLDPYDLTISTDADAGTSGFTATASGANINTTTLDTALATANVTISTGSSGSETGNITINNPIAWSAPTSLTLNAAGSIFLNSSITNSGASAGSITLVAGGTLSGAPGSAITTQGQAINLTGAPVTGAMSIDANGGLVTVNQTGAGTITGTLSGAGGLTLAGAGTLTLAGANTYTGASTVSSGILQAGSVSAFGTNSAVTLTSNGTLDLNGFNVSIGSLAGTGGTVTNSSPTAARLATGGLNASTTFSGVIQDGTGVLGLTETGSGTLTLANAETFTGALQIDQGVISTNTPSVVLASGASLATSAVNIGNGSTAGPGYYAILQTNSANQLSNALVTFNGAVAKWCYWLLNGTNQSVLGINDATASGVIEETEGGSSLASTLTLTGSGSYSFNGYMRNTFNGAGDSLALAMQATGTQTLVGSGITYTGNTTVNAGTLQAGSNGALSASSAVVLATGGTLDLNGYSNSIGSLAGTGGTVTNSRSPAATLTSGGNETSTSYAGAIQNGAGTVSLTQNGTGTLTLAGANTYTGTTSVTAGTLNLSGSLDVGAATENVVVNPGATLSGTGSLTASRLSVSGAGSVNLAGNNAVGSVSGTGTIGTLTLNDAQSLSVGNISATGSVTLEATGAGANLTIGTGKTIASAATGNAIVLAAALNFVNDAGSAALATPNGRWLVYSNAPGTDTFGTLNSNRTAIWNATPATLPPASVTQGGDRYLFAYQPTVTFTSTNDTKTYGADATASVAASYTVSAGAAGVSGIFLADTSATMYSGTPSVTSSGSAATATVGGGPYSILVSTGALTALDGYALAFQNNGQLTVNPATLTITATNQGKTYGQTASLGTTSFTETGLVNSDTITGVTLASSGSVATATVAGGPYAIVPSNAQGTGLGNYTIGYVNGALTVSPATLTITATNQGKTYGQTASLGTTNFTETGLVNSDTITGVTLTSSGSVATASVAGGPYAIVPSNAQGSGLGNYTLDYVNGALTVSPATLTITATNQGKTYGQTASLGTTGFTESGLVNSDTITGVTLTSSGSVATATVAGGPYAIVPSNAQGSGLGNYTLDYVNGALTVSPATLTITATNQGKTYGQTASLGTTRFTETGLVNSDTITGVTLTSSGSVATATVAGGPYAIVPSNAQGSGLGNYTLDYVNGALTVSPATLTITATNQGKTYGQTASLGTTGFTETGLVNSDTITGVTLTSSGSVATATVAGGPYAIVPGNAQGTGLGNYTIAYVNGALTVSPATLTITATNQGKTYGQTASLGTTSITETGLVNSDTITGVTLTSSGSVATATVAGGPYAIVPSNAQGSGLGNYTLDYVNGALTVSPATLTITATNQGKTYGQTASLGTTGFTETGLVNSDTITGVTLTSSGSAAAATVAGGPYAIVPSNAQGTGLGNYTLDYVNGALTVSPATLTITATNQGKTYGQTASLGTTGFTETGLVNNDTITGVTLTSPGSVATATVAGGPYTIVPGNAQGSGLGNYTLDYVNGALTVSPAALTITATNQSKTYGQTASLGTTRFTETGLVNSDTITGVTLTSSGAVSTANVTGTPYAIVPGNAQGTGLGNYTVSYVNGNLTVNPAPITITTPSGNSYFGLAPVDPGMTVNGLQNGQGPGVLTGLGYNFAIGSQTSPGTYPILVTGSLTNPNYRLIGVQTGTWTVQRSAPSGTATPSELTPAFHWTRDTCQSDEDCCPTPRLTLGTPATGGSAPAGRCFGDAKPRPYTPQ